MELFSTAQKMKISVKVFFSKCEQSFLRISSYLVKTPGKLRFLCSEEVFGRATVIKNIAKLPRKHF